MTLLSDLLVEQSFINAFGDAQIEPPRPATVADLVAALIEEGAEVISWCEEHSASAVAEGVPWCWPWDQRGVPGDRECRMVSSLIYRLPEDKP